MRAVRIAALAAVCALAGVASGCGGGGGSDTTTTQAASVWADGFCGAFADWRAEFDRVKGQFTSLSSFSKANLQKAGDDLNAATETLIDDLKGLGTPDTASGQEIKDSIDSLTTTLQTQKDDIQSTIEDASGLTGIASAAKDVSASLGTMNDAMQSTLTTIHGSEAKGELEDALTNAPQCKSLTS